MSTKKSFIEEFKEFISRGSVMDLAVGIIIGGAFTSIVNSLVNDILMPVIGLVAGGVDFTNLAITIPNFFGSEDAAVIKYGNFIQNIVNFLIIAFALFLVIRIINRMNERAKAAAENAAKKLGRDLAKEQADEKAADDAEKKAERASDAKIEKLLTEIRDELKKSGKKSTRK